MSDLLDEFSDMIDEQAEIDNLPENVSKRLLVSYQEFLDNPSKTFSGVDKNSIQACLKVCETEEMPWEHVCMAIDVSVLRDISKPRLSNFSIPPFVEELEGIGNKNNSGFGFNEFGRNHLKSVVIPSSVCVISKETFAFYRKLESVTMPQESKLRNIGKDAFAYCENLKELDLSNCEYLQYLPEYLIASSGTKKLRINSSIQSIHPDTFKASSLDTVYVDNDKYSFTEFFKKITYHNFKAFW